MKKIVFIFTNQLFVITLFYYLYKGTTICLLYILAYLKCAMYSRNLSRCSDAKCLIPRNGTNLQTTNWVKVRWTNDK